ncbi:uncharacterized protein LOC110887930 [Helianthus annuus]|uniref:uncharacterized protein LOC110887930 n=1 Tax=Helianthus annuus TaxID=4232 RepID=UPI000B8FB3E4|nr:uncharacterized protein LOC110887930 [Helianthus annuus]
MVESANGRMFSKIDSVLACKNFQNKWPEACVRVLPRGHSDHNPVMVIVNNLNFGPRPFRFFSSWLERNDFQKVVDDTLAKFRFSGPPDKRLIAKFKALRDKIRAWRDNLRFREGEEEARAKEELEELDLILEDRELTNEEEWIRLECKRKLQFLEDMKSKDLKQKARTRWAMEGDDNTAFFHGMVNKRKSSNSIPGLVVDGEWVSKPSKVKKMVFDFFRSKFKEDMKNQPFMECSFDKKLSEAEANSLIEVFSKEEIKAAVF